MPKIAYDHPSILRMPAAMEVITQAEIICDRYAAEGYQLTLRQLYYRFIAEDLFPEARRDPESGTKNTERNYKWLGALISDARVGGMIDWRHITDRTRGERGGDGGYGSPREIVASTEDAYYIPLWEGQSEYVEVWVEKEALADVIARPADRWRTPYFACKGYVSQSSMHDAALRLRGQERAGKKCTVIHLGDHDPSGIDMTRDIADRLALFRSSASVDRIALNMDQVLALNPPPSPAKITDSRANDYIDQYGTDSWELDAIEPAALDTLVNDAIVGHLDMDAWNARIARQSNDKRILRALSYNWDDVSVFLRDNGYVEPGDDGDDDE